MGDTMNYVALTGISENVVRQLRDNVLLTIEIRNPKNFYSALKLNVGDYVLLTSTGAEDVRKGTAGIVCKVMKHQVSTHRMVQANGMFYEEREMTMARLQLNPKGSARITKINSNGLGEVSCVEAELITCYDAR
ncbi:Protein of unknown function DUF473 [Methanosalsum zhilinae DSM 4017]|uniref:Uncharacterized protein n=2 Tax=Methanosalsum zhilinae TaxID=39669 RepID=F7XNM2_METZD|nr:Protein of unknown function DUF473 [Methanosalsum zhilinae DSM 4017]